VVVTPPTARPDPVGAVGGSDARGDEVGALFLSPFVVLPSSITRLVPAGAVGSGVVRGDEAGAAVAVPRVVMPTPTARTDSRGAVGGGDASGDDGSTLSLLPLVAFLQPTTPPVPTGVFRDGGVRGDEAGAPVLLSFVVLPPLASRAVPAGAVPGGDARGDEVGKSATVLPVAFVVLPASLAPSASEQPSAVPALLPNTSLSFSLVALVASARARLRRWIEEGSLAFSCRLRFRVAGDFFEASTREAFSSFRVILTFSFFGAALSDAAPAAPPEDRPAGIF